MMPFERARDHARSQQRNGRENPWDVANELNALLTQFKAEDTQSAVAFRNQSLQDPSSRPPETTLTRLVRFWNEQFPGRTIDFSSYETLATSSLGGTEISYQVSRMSDGERVSLYLTASLLDADPGLVVVDEPEVYLHSVLARRLWDAFELIRPDCRFVYITHDLPFALSRLDPQFVIVRPATSPEVLPRNSAIPDGVFEAILGAASFSVTAKRIVFCEGVRGGNRDEALYSAWFNGPETAVIPVGSCKMVRQCVEVFNGGETIRGGTSIGIIDRDYWPNEYFATLPAAVHVLAVHEVESLFFLPGVFTAVARYVQIPVEEIPRRYEAFLAGARASFHGALFNKQILERAKKRVELNTARLLNSVSVNPDLDRMRHNFESAIQPATWPFDPAMIFTEEESRVTASLAGDVLDFLSLFPGKSYISLGPSQLGLTAERYVEIVLAGLSSRGEDGSSHTRLYEEIEESLKDYLPPRRAE